MDRVMGPDAGSASEDRERAEPRVTWTSVDFLSFLLKATIGPLKHCEQLGHEKKQTLEMFEIFLDGRT